MFQTKTPALRHSFTAAICAILFSATCLVAAAGPVRAATPLDRPAHVSVPLA